MRVPLLMSLRVNQVKQPKVVQGDVLQDQGGNKVRHLGAVKGDVHQDQGGYHPEGGQ